MVVRAYGMVSVVVDSDSLPPTTTFTFPVPAFWGTRTLICVSDQEAPLNGVGLPASPYSHDEAAAM